MVPKRNKRALQALLSLAGLLILGVHSSAAEHARLQVAVAEPDIEAIVRAVGGDQVDTFSLFKGCILRKDLAVEPSVRERLLKADAVVWTGFFNESAAIHESIKPLDQKGRESRPQWIDVSRDVQRVNVPISTCFGYVEPSFMHGDPFFWLNPRNGIVIARNVAEGLGNMRPERREYFLANAQAFDAALRKDIERWRAELRPLSGLRVFTAQCGWNNFSQIGGPTFASCKQSPGVLPAPDELVRQVKALNVSVVIVDPNTPPEYGRAFREGLKAKVIEVPSSIESLTGAKSYSALFDNFIQSLQEAAKS